jgi:membrane protease subunit HflC
MRKIPVPTLLTAAIVVVVLLVYALTFQVRFSEVAVRVRLGNVVNILEKPGIYRRWPWPIETVQKYDKRLRTLDTGEGEIVTQDGKSVIVASYAVWRIQDPLKFSTSVLTIPRAEEQLRARINQRRGAVIGNQKLSAFVNLNEELVNSSYDQVEAALLTGQQAEGEQGGSLRDQFLKDCGIYLEKVALRRISLPEETTQSVFQQMVAERQKEAARFREEGKARATTITRQAEAAGRQILAFAESKGEQYRSTGVQASTRILEQIKAEDAEFFEWLRWLDALRLALHQKSTIFLDNNSALFKPFVEPPATMPARP